MSDKLLERLRRKDHWTQHKPYWHARNPDGEEAAAEIERLRAVLDTLPDEIDLYRVMKRAGRKRIDQAKAIAAILQSLTDRDGEG